MKNKKMILVAVALIACVAVMLGIFLTTRPETVAGSRDEIMDAGFVEDEDSPEGIFDYDDGMDAGDEE